MAYEGDGIRGRERNPKTKAPRESTFQHKLLKKLKAIPCSKWFVKEAKSIRGIPDIIGCINGKYIALEVKRSEAEAMGSTGRIVLQKHFIAEVKKVKGYGSLVYPENTEQVLEELWAFVP